MASPSVIDWLLAGDPAIRWQTLRDLTDAPSHRVASERARVPHAGWGRELLDLQRDDGQWGDGMSTPWWWSNLYSLVYLRDLGVDPQSAPVVRALERVQRHVTWGAEFGDSPFFEGEVEPCINGRVLALGAYFGVRSDALAARLVGEQLQDGGWNCEAERGSTRSSFHTTICVLEGVLAFERAFGTSPALAEARRRGEEYLLERSLLRRKSTGQVIDRDWTQFAFPPLWHFDVLRAVDYFRSTGDPADPRIEQAVAVLHQRQDADGRWLLDVRHKDTLYPQFAGHVGQPNRWVTLRALRSVRWYHASQAT